MKKSNHEFTPPEMIAIWNALSDIMDFNEDRGATFEAFRKRIMAALQPELKFWQELSQEERDVLSAEKVSFSFTKIPADSLPELIPDHTHIGLSLVLDGEIPQYTPKLARLLKKKTKKEKV